MSVFGSFATASSIVLPSTSYVIGQDVAKDQDYTTTVIHQIKPEAVPSASGSPRVFVFEDEVFRDKRRLKYTELPVYTKELISSLDMEGRSALVIDKTGVGNAIYDMYDEAGLDPLGIIFSGGASAQMHTSQRIRSQFGQVSHITVPKADLIGALKLAVEQGRLRIAEGLMYAREAEAQFRHFVGKFNSQTGNVKLENDSPDVHDDFVVTEAMCAWYVLHMKGHFEQRAKRPTPRSENYRNNIFNDKEWL